MIWPIKKLGEILVGIIFITSATFLFFREEYILGTIFILALLLLLKLNTLAEFAFAGFQAKFITPKEKVEEDIEENKQPITNQNFVHFSNIEARILTDIQKKYDGQMKTLIHFVYGWPDKPEFRYTPDGTLQTDDTLYFFEIKYILKPELAKGIVENAIRYLNDVYSKLAPSAGKKLVIKLIIASGYDLSQMTFNPPKGIEIEFYKV